MTMCRIVVCRSSRNPDRRAPQPGDPMKVVESGVFVGKVFENSPRYRVVDLGEDVPAADFMFLLTDQKGFGLVKSAIAGDVMQGKRQMFRSYSIDIGRLEAEELALRGKLRLEGHDVVLAARDRFERAISVKPHAQDPRGTG
jgi:hypothetical protein